MNKYAYIKDDIVWEIVKSDKKPEWPPTEEGIKPLFVKIPKGEQVETGFGYNEATGVFTPYEGYIPPEERPHNEPVPEKTVEERLAEVEDLQFIQLEAMADIAELLLGGEKQ